ncbi:MAG: phospholipase D-like domain-containing protein [Elusimicrobiales bacterium]|nr:phospholipase D-like domain-containing protein [Elusimicrobiales bacterium]
MNWRDYCLDPGIASGGNSAVLLKGGAEAFAAMEELILSARRSLLLEFYSFADDSVGRRFGELLVSRAAAGVETYLIYDAVGSIRTDGDFFRDLARRGVRVGAFHPMVPWKPHWNWGLRNHRKMFCADSSTVIVGGFNLTERDAPRSMGGGGWKDAQVKVSGPVAAEIEGLFWNSWALCGKRPPPPGASPKAPGGEHAAVLSASGFRQERSIRRSYRHAIDRARKRIRITNAYFLPDRIIRKSLMRAARRGVDVRIITPGKTDHPYVLWASWAMFPRMIRSGVRIYEWTGEILHSKTAVIDGVWSSVGSHNLDHRSLHYNLELNVNVFGPAFGRAMEDLFEADLRSCREVTREECRSRPFLHKAASAVLYMLRSWL